MVLRAEHISTFVALHRKWLIDLIVFYAECIGNISAIYGNVTLWVINSREERKATNKQTNNKQT